MNERPVASTPTPTLNDPELFKAVAAVLWSDVVAADEFPNLRPLVAHYTSLATLEQIVIRDEVWFSNPLYMNDVEEVRFGMHEGLSAFRQHTGIANACGDHRRREILRYRVEQLFFEFEHVHAFDTYVFCCSIHQPDDNDGLLSMWRGYGGNGGGAAIVLNCSQMNANPSSPIMISPVRYGSRERRLAWIKSKLDQFEQVLRSMHINDSQLQAAALALVGRILTFALVTKHHGFSEEKEWRFIYRKQMDTAQLFTSMLGYAIGLRGIEPKFKLKLEATDQYPNLCLSALVDRIILGPTVSGEMAVASVKRMLELQKKGYLIPRIVASGTPFRAV